MDARRSQRLARICGSVLKYAPGPSEVSCPGHLRIDASGNWSGGGRVVIANLAAALAQRPAEVQHGKGGPRWLLARNSVPLSRLAAGDYILMPQNALPWGPKPRRMFGLARFILLRLASTVAIRRAAGVIRISESIPAAANCSSIVHNVLDAGFEEALQSAASNHVFGEARGRFFAAMGALSPHRNHLRILDAYELYRASGGTVELRIMGAAGSRSYTRAVQRRASGMPGVQLSLGTLSRSQTLRWMRKGEAVICASLVEASPITFLEALALGRPVLASAILPQLSLADRHGGAVTWCDPLDVESLTAAMRAIERDSGGATSQSLLELPSEREKFRREWYAEIAVEAADICAQARSSRE